MTKSYTVMLAIVILLGCRQSQQKQNIPVSDSFPTELVHFEPYQHNPVFAGTNANTWDKKIRERGYILFEDSIYRMWYTGYNNEKADRHPGYATSTDGLTWKRYSDKPIYDADWVEDMCIIKHDSIYYMFAEGRDDIAHILISADGINWKEKGNIDIRKTNGEPIDKGEYGTPTIWYENKTWYLFYERGDLGIWLATSKDMNVWTNVQDDPVLALGPDAYDKYAVAMNQVIKYDGKYYGYYHASDTKEWKEWSVNIAMSDDLIHWKKYEHNPIMQHNRSSGIVVNNGKGYRLYTMHPDVNVFLPAEEK
ncbi:MAG: glycosylase [Terrimonas sp.]|nr:glycosylase [Terrimonas sp.]OJY89995.1 MAG: glycosylase [Sphingobacteriales bacterium 40-81]